MQAASQRYRFWWRFALALIAVATCYGDQASVRARAAQESAQPLPAPRLRVERLPPVNEAQPVQSPRPEEVPAPQPQEPEPVATPAPDAPVDPQELEASRTRMDRLLDGVLSVVHPSIWEIWEGSVEFGMSGTQGNSQTFNMRFGTHLKHCTPNVRHDYELTHLKKSNQTRQIANNTLLDGRVEWPLPGLPWTYFIHGSSEHDRFKAFDVRVAGDTGLGYQFLNSKASNLVARLGGSFSREVGGPADRYVPEILAGVELKHRLADGQKVSANVEYFPDVSNFADFRLNGRASWEKAIAPKWGLSLKLSAIDRYDSTPNRRERNDLDYSCLLLWSF